MFLQMFQEGSIRFMKKIRNRLVLFCALIVFLWMLPAQKPMAAALNDEPEQTEDEETVPGETEIAGEPVRALPELADADYGKKSVEL